MSDCVQTLEVSQQKTTIFSAQWLNRMIDSFVSSRRRKRELRQLQNLSEHMLRDIGLTRADIEALDEHRLADFCADRLQRKWPEKSNF